MKISVIGLGYLGATHAVAMAKLGHNVIGIDPDSQKVASLSSGKVPFFEPGLEATLHEVLQSGLVKFQTQHTEESASADIHFLCVGTPQNPDGSANVSYLHKAVADLAPNLNPDSLVVGKSTVPVGTAADLKIELAKLCGIEPKLVWNPEFLREGTALEDSLAPDRIVIGSWNADDARPLIAAYEKLFAAGSPLVELDVPTAELVKVAANAFLATKVSFINAMAEIAEASGADAVKLAEAIGYDERIGNKFLRTGIGFGGGCLPKDIRGFVARANELGVGESLRFLTEVDKVNLRRRAKVVELAKELLGDLNNKRITVLGIAFKPNSDDLRDSPALEIARELSRQGAIVTVTDPKALEQLSEPGLKTEPDTMAALTDAELVILGTEWDEYRKLDANQVGNLVSSKKIIDGRNVLDVAAWQKAGWKLVALGRNV